MNLLQAWVAVGVPGLVIAVGLFVGRSQTRAYVGYGVLAALFAFFLLLENGVYSALAVGTIAVGYLANGRGLNNTGPEHHQERSKFTRA
jgi:uncharacterized membrane protein YjjB (DUF3815 family)